MALAGVAQGLELQPAYLRATGSICSQGQVPGLQVRGKHTFVRFPVTVAVVITLPKAKAVIAVFQPVLDNSVLEQRQTDVCGTRLSFQEVMCRYLLFIEGGLALLY